MPLTALEIKNAKPGMHADGNGLYLNVKPGGAKSWIFRFQISGRRREMGLGSLANVEPVAARAEAARLKAMVASGTDPIEQKRKSKAEADEIATAEELEQQLEAATFRVAAEKYIAAQEAGWSNHKHSQQWTNTLKTYAYPVIGDMPVRDITAQHIVEILKPIWSTKSETASRVRMRIEAVLNSAKLMGWRTGENPAVWRGGLEAALPRISKVRRVRHHPAMPWQDIAPFMAKLREREGISPRALEFVILTAARSGEVRNASWDEIDLDRALWVVPAERMKAGREHRVPLSKAAIKLLEQLPRIDKTPLLFPGMHNGPMSDMTLGAVLKRMDLGQFTVHGFRSTFRDWAAESTSHSPEAVEMALAHTVANRVEAAYRRGDLFEKRRELMEDWATWCCGSMDSAERR
ncbi:tyrosine-type recombinase/integrase [Altererythrobacter sp. GH1-8]|uniref:tyrosine-type recombinase/integrase n=1 Tax=Altererythrobacter sp. GH1-8 TaxID=3349333 RepID=UPI00374D1E92